MFELLTLCGTQIMRPDLDLCQRGHGAPMRILSSGHHALKLAWDLINPETIASDRSFITNLEVASHMQIWLRQTQSWWRQPNRLIPLARHASNAYNNMTVCRSPSSKLSFNVFRLHLHLQPYHLQLLVFSDSAASSGEPCQQLVSCLAMGHL